jgi:uncharacterized membrane protein YhdT
MDQAIVAGVNPAPQAAEVSQAPEAPTFQSGPAKGEADITDVPHAARIPTVVRTSLKDDDSASPEEATKVAAVATAGWVTFSLVLAFIFFWPFLVGWIASTRGRSGVGWFLLACLITPLFSIIILLCLPRRFQVNGVWMTETEIQQMRITNEFAKA